MNIKTKYLTFALLPFLVLVIGFTDLQVDKNQIRWDGERPLTWKDFKGTQPKNAPFAALTSWLISLNSKPIGDSIEIAIGAYFDMKESKVKQNSRKDSMLLSHEQYHFNIAELYSRKLRKKLQELVFSKKDFGKKIPKLYNDVMADCKKEQDLYDKETQHSIKTAEQSRWELKIDKELTELQGYTWPSRNFELK